MRFFVGNVAELRMENVGAAFGGPRLTKRLQMTECRGWRPRQPVSFIAIVGRRGRRPLQYVIYICCVKCGLPKAAPTKS